MRAEIFQITRDALDLARLEKQQGHKYDHGHALILSGGAGRTGAARLAARGALRIGAGAVSLGVPPSAQMEVANQITAAMLIRVPDSAALNEALEDSRLNAICVGPGLGLKPAHADLVAAVLASGRPCVLDADALTLIAQDAALFQMLHEGCVLTPHGGEFARLFRAQSALPPQDATCAAAQRAGATVLLKGARTFIGKPDGAVACHAAEGADAVPWLATAGSGDVLAGFITGLQARGFSSFDAACFGAWLHAACARRFGPGLIAEDLPEQLPQVFADVLERPS